MPIKQVKKFWEFRAAAEDDTSAELLLMGPISSETWWGDEVTPKLFADELKGLGDVKNITVRINSNGGDVFAGNTIHNLLKSHKATVTAKIDGIAASIASVIAMAADKVVMPENAMMMIHNPSAYVGGDARDHREMAAVLDKVRDSLITAYQSKTGIDRSKLINMLNSTTWMSAQEAVDLGFADEVDTAAKVTAEMAKGQIILNGVGFDINALGGYPVMPHNALASSPDEGGEDITASAAAEQNNEEDISMSANAQQQPAAPPAPAPEQPSAAAPVAEDVRAQILAEDRARVAAIQKLAEPGAEEIISAAIENGDSPEATAFKICTSEDVKKARALAARAADAQDLEGVEGGEPQPQADAQKNVIDKMVDAGTRHLKFLKGGGGK